MSGNPLFKGIKTKGRYRSIFERKIGHYLSHHRIKFKYEQRKLKFYMPSLNGLVCPTCGPIRGLVERHYTPDFELLHNGVIIEAKGRLTASDRSKMRAIVKQHPNVDIRILFMQDNIIKESADKLRYTEWAAKYGIPSAIGPTVPAGWMAGRNRPTRLEKAYRDIDEHDNQVVPQDSDDSAP